MTAKTIWNASDIPICERAKKRSFKIPPSVMTFQASTEPNFRFGDKQHYCVLSQRPSRYPVKPAGTGSGQPLGFRVNDSLGNTLAIEGCQLFQQPNSPGATPDHAV